MLIQGKAKWAKIMGAPSWGYENKFKEWSVDVYLDDETVAKLKAEGLGKKLKDKGNGTYITFKRKEIGIDRVTGDPKNNDPIRVVDHRGTVLQNGQPDNPDYVKGTLKIGNGSTVNVSFIINEYGKGEKAANILSLQVWDLVPYESNEFPTREDDTGGKTAEDWTEEEAA
jgi:hypothetical protein